MPDVSNKNANAGADSPAADRPVCVYCGATEDLSFDADPYAEEIHNDDTPVWECDCCRRESARDI